jgi:hypothetical protein
VILGSATGVVEEFAAGAAGEEESCACAANV